MFSSTQLLLNFQKEANFFAKDPKVSYAYGTAGFRMRAELMKPVAFRVGLLAVLLAWQYGGESNCIGVMLTASHNPVQDNGIKLVAPDGGMIPVKWEQIATDLANVPESELPRFLDQLSAAAAERPLAVRIALGRDTRPSGPELVEAVRAGIRALCPDAEMIDLGMQTTPQFHFAVSLLTQNTWTPTAYIDHFVNAFKDLLACIRKEPRGHLIVDCANGIGAATASAVKEKLKCVYSALQISLINEGARETDVLNSECGADFVKMNQKPPKGAQDSASTSDARIATFDGDADRLLYVFFEQTSGAFQLLDGDRIAMLFAHWLKKLLKSSNLTGQLSLGVVQTAYANGASTNYIRNVLQVPVEMACTGVKNLHHAAHEKFDIGVYFEANGHGTVLFSEKAQAEIPKAAQEGGSDAQTLLLLSKLINQCVGDALCDMLVVEAALLALDLDLPSWTSLYADLPNIQLKVQVPNRTIYQTNHADTRLAEPLGIQEQIDAAVAGIELGRAFVRPSGTEDVVRIYAEAATAKDCEDLANNIAKRLV